jgi:hypothetical protein
MAISVMGTPVPENSVYGSNLPAVANQLVKMLIAIKNVNARDGKRGTSFLAVSPDAPNAVFNLDFQATMRTVRNAQAETDQPVAQTPGDLIGVYGEMTGLLSINYVEQEDADGKAMRVEEDGEIYTVYGRQFQVTPTKFTVADSGKAASLKDLNLDLANSRSGNILTLAQRPAISRIGGRGNASALEVTEEFTL